MRTPARVGLVGCGVISRHYAQNAEAFDSFEHWVGGACNCLNSELLHKCTTNVTWTPNRRGFRCCADPS